MGDEMNNIIEAYVSKLTKEDILSYGIKNNLTITNAELNFIFDFIKKNYKTILNDPHSFNLEDYKDKFSEENYLFLEKMISKYKRMIV